MLTAGKKEDGAMSDRTTKALLFTIALGFGMVFCIAVLVAAPRSVWITFHSDPEGATVYEQGTNRLFGSTPVEARYSTSKVFQKGTSCDTVRGVLVRWASGAETSLTSIQICPQDGGKQELSIIRPIAAPGRELDVQVALELQRNALLQQQARQGRAARRPFTPTRIAETCLSASAEQQTGGNKICYYNCPSGKAAITVGFFELCPLQIQR